MQSDFFGAVSAFGVGLAIATVNYLLSRYMLKKKPSQYAVTQIFRQVLQVGYLVLLFVFGDYTPWDKLWLLVGGALGVTLPMLWFTYRLVKLNELLNGKEESADG